MTDNYDLTGACLVAIAQSLPSLEEIFLIRCGRVTDAGIICLAISCPKLQVVDFSSTAVSNVGLAALVENCRDLKYVDTRGCKNLIGNPAEQYPHLKIRSDYGDWF